MLLPKVGSFFHQPQMQVIVCGKCGHIRLFASENDLELLVKSRHWTLMR